MHVIERIKLSNAWLVLSSDIKIKHNKFFVVKTLTIKICVIMWFDNRWDRWSNISDIQLIFFSFLYFSRFSKNLNGVLKFKVWRNCKHFSLKFCAGWMILKSAWILTLLNFRSSLTSTQIVKLNNQKFYCRYIFFFLKTQYIMNTSAKKLFEIMKRKYF